MRIVKYDVVCAHSSGLPNKATKKLKSIVDIRISNGWQPLGPATISVQSIEVYATQTLVKYECDF